MESCNKVYNKVSYSFCCHCSVLEGEEALLGAHSNIVNGEAWRQRSLSSQECNGGRNSNRVQTVQPKHQSRNTGWSTSSHNARALAFEMLPSKRSMDVDVESRRAAVPNNSRAVLRRGRLAQRH